MSLNEMADGVLSGGDLVFRQEGRDGAVFRDAISGQRLLILKHMELMKPILDGQPIQARLTDVEYQRQAMVLRFTSPRVADLCVRLEAGENYLDMSCSFTVEKGCQLNRLQLFPADAMLNMYDLVNFRNRQRTPITWPELNLGQAFETDTFSRDWQFAPHPSLFIFRKGRIHLLAALAELPRGTFGMYFSVNQCAIKHWYLDYGDQPHGLALKAGETFMSPRLRLMLRREETVYETLDAFAATLVREGRIPDPADRRRESWWDQPLYCTWIDQVFKSGGTEQAREMLDEGLVRQAAAIIRREKLPIDTILIDDGWSVTRGQWEVQRQRFADMRRLVDELHGQGFKVMVWLGWPDVWDDAEVPSEFLCDGGRWRNCHGNRVVDYSSPITRDKYLRPLMHKLFSGDEGCYDLDGLKTDFQADKVHGEMPLADPQWRGEENYLARVTRLLYEQLKCHKPDGMHLGCAGHFWIGQYIDLNRTYDVHSSDWREHEQRALMLRHTAPGVGVSYDFHCYLENLEAWFDSADRLKAAVEIGNVMYVKDDFFSEARRADAAYYQRLRAAMG